MSPEDMSAAVEVALGMPLDDWMRGPGRAIIREHRRVAAAVAMSRRAQAMTNMALSMPRAAAAATRGMLSAAAAAAATAPRHLQVAAVTLRARILRTSHGSRKS